MAIDRERDGHFGTRSGGARQQSVSMETYEKWKRVAEFEPARITKTITRLYEGILMSDLCPRYADIE